MNNPNYNHLKFEDQAAMVVAYIEAENEQNYAEVHEITLMDAKLHLELGRLLSISEPFKSIPYKALVNIVRNS